jgi:ectoine hydroxylase-related dioxygenase (phytanoyl-CoA dioxygenase family)
MLISMDQINQYHNDGFLIVENLLTDQEVSDFLNHESKPKPEDWQKGLRTHTADPQWQYLATHPNITGITRQLLNDDSQIVQSMYLNKKSDGGQGIAIHQDTLYIKNEPNTLMACWVAMDDTDPENGGLCVVPGSHLKGLQSAHKNLNSSEHISWETDYEMQDQNGQQWTERLHSFEMDDVKPDEILKLTVPRGGGVFFTGLTIHGSYANRSLDRIRRAFAIHYVKNGTWVFRTDIQELTPSLR